MITILEIVRKIVRIIRSRSLHLAIVLSCSYICTDTRMALTKVLPYCYIVDPDKLAAELAVGAMDGLIEPRGLIR